MNTFKFALTLIFISLSSVACKNEVKNNKSEKSITKSFIKYAKGFEIQQFNDYKKVIIKAPYNGSKETFEFILTPNKTTKNNEITIPVNSIVVTSTTHIPMLELLNVENKLIGYPNTDYVSSVKTRALINNGKIKELGNEESINTELLLDLNPNVVMGFSINSNSKMFSTIQQFGIPVILNGDWLEETPLGRAEWIKLFGVLFNKEKQADSIFNEIEKNYLEAKSIALNATNQPTIISGGLFKDIWNLPAGNSFEATFLKDANTNYLWKNTEGKGSLSLNIENVFEKGKDADIWISPSFHTSLEDLKTSNAIYSQFNAFKNKTIYSFINKRGEKGGFIYFELAPARPDLVLKDIIKIAHPELLKDYELTFFEQLK
ncbi:ABC transporter substrate-binding protein [Lutibacter maritimus]|uniref:Iron complex transport system substrate-binding protein n=1 Tax=Lutibacter maritimus TaxID=593133 RepID=A0A1I6NYA8_9FLAO|nr:ABC transporter substrate-binding protein [Lutibacter maritimus]SFS32838.1 iron complex transport system substrate-binding protein [Lutibacter maritimus]